MSSFNDNLISCFLMDQDRSIDTYGQWKAADSPLPQRQGSLDCGRRPESPERTYPALGEHASSAQSSSCPEGIQTQNPPSVKGQRLTVSHCATQVRCMHKLILYHLKIQQQFTTGCSGYHSCVQGSILSCGLGRAMWTLQILPVCFQQLQVWQVFLFLEI